MARLNIDQIRGLQDYATLYNWDLEIQAPSVAGLVTTDTINLRCTSTSLPVLTDKKITVAIRSHKVHQPGIHDYSGSIVLNFVETIDNKINLMLQQWREKCWRSKSGYQEKREDVKGIFTLKRLNRQDQTIWVYILKGVFLESYTQPDLTADDSQTFNPSMTVSYDYFEDYSK